MDDMDAMNNDLLLSFHEGPASLALEMDDFANKVVQTSTSK